MNRAKAVTGDFNGDGQERHHLPLQRGRLDDDAQFLASGSASVKEVFRSTQWFWEKTKLVAGDFDGNGKDELFAFYSYGPPRPGSTSSSRTPRASSATAGSSRRTTGSGRRRRSSRQRRRQSKGSRRLQLRRPNDRTLALRNGGRQPPYPSRVFMSNNWIFEKTTFLTGTSTKTADPT